MNKQNLLVIGGGPIGLITAWTLSKTKGTYVEVFSKSGERKRNYDIFIGGNQANKKQWRPNYLEEVKNSIKYDMIFVAKPFKYAKIFLESNRDLWESNKVRILILCSIAGKFDEYNDYVTLAWPNISVEIVKHKINATGPLKLEILSTDLSMEGSEVEKKVKDLGIDLIRAKDINHFNFLALNTYATYKALARREVCFNNKKSIWLETVYKIIEDMKLNIDDFEMHIHQNISKYAEGLFKELEIRQQEEDSSPLGINLKLLITDKCKMQNYIEEYEEQLNNLRRTTHTLKSSQ